MHKFKTKTVTPYFSGLLLNSKLDQLGLLSTSLIFIMNSNNNRKYLQGLKIPSHISLYQDIPHVLSQ